MLIILTLKIEKFLKSTAIELDFSNDVTEQGRYSPRFLTEVADELDVIQDKKDSLFSKYYQYFQ